MRMKVLTWPTMHSCIRGVDSNLLVTEETLDIKSMHGTTTGKRTSKCNQHETAQGQTYGAYNKWSSSYVRWKKWMSGKGAGGEVHWWDHSIPLHHTPGSALWQSPKHGACNEPTVNFIRAKGLNRRRFHSFMQEIYWEFADIPYHTEETQMFLAVSTFL